jgi:hypothetical protein
MAIGGQTVPALAN